MATLNDAQAAAWKLARDVDWNPDSAIGKKWVALKAAGTLIGVPIGPEIPIDDGTVAQAFTSGAVLRWTGGEAVEVI